MTDHIDKWTNYRDSRQGTYEFRARTRYNAVADKLYNLGLQDDSVVLDVGAGTCQFGRYLSARGWKGWYWPVDAVLDGVDLETYVAPKVDFVVCIEVVEHLHKPFRLIDMLQNAARHGFVLTTPNSETVDVIGCDPTHVSIVSYSDLLAKGFKIERHSWFGTIDDTLLAW